MPDKPKSPEEIRSYLDLYLGQKEETPETYQPEDAGYMQQALATAAGQAIGRDTSEGAKLLAEQRQREMAEALRVRKEQEARAAKTQAIRDSLMKRGAEEALFPRQDQRLARISEGYGAVGIDEQGREVPLIMSSTEGYLDPVTRKPWTGKLKSREQFKQERFETSQEFKETKETQRQKEKKRGYLQKQSKEFDSRVKNLEQGLTSANAIKEALDKNPRQALSIVKTQMPRLAGEVGNLSETEQLAWAGDPSILETIKRWGNKQFLKDAVLTDRDIQELNAALSILAQNQEKTYGLLRERYVTRAKDDTGFEDTEIDKYFGKPLEFKGPKGKTLDDYSDEELLNMSEEEFQKLEAATGK